MDFYTLYQYKLRISNQCILTEVAVIFTAYSIMARTVISIADLKEKKEAYADLMEVAAWPVQYFFFKQQRDRKRMREIIIKIYH